MSISRGFSEAIARFDSSTPGTIDGSTQWSPDQLRSLSLKTVSVTCPVAHSQLCR